MIPFGTLRHLTVTMVIILFCIVKSFSASFFFFFLFFLLHFCFFSRESGIYQGDTSAACTFFAHVSAACAEKNSIAYASDNFSPAESLGSARLQCSNTSSWACLPQSSLTAQLHISVKAVQIRALGRTINYKVDL